jgi:hypothetical protein
MAAKLRLVKSLARDFKTLAPVREDRFRYPAHEEVWEVSCEPDRSDRRRPITRQDSRRAS